MPKYCHRCHITIEGYAHKCKACMHHYCKACYLTYHWHTPEQNLFSYKLW